MAKLDNVRRIIAEDFPKDQQDLITKLSLILNTFMENTYNVLNKRVDFDNLNAEVITLKVTVNGGGSPNVVTKFSTTDIANSIGGWCISCTNLANPNAYAISAPFVTFVNVSDKLFQVKNVSGLAPNVQYELKLVVFAK